MSIIVFFAFVSSGRAQDKIYLMNGQKLVGNVESISQDEVVVTAGGQEHHFSPNDIIVIEYKNGKTEVFSYPKEDLSFDPKASSFADVAPVQKTSASNFFSVNTLALCIADISAFYEYMPKKKPFAFGAMGSYNFNLHSTLPNLFITTLPNARKNYDAGLTCHVFPFEFEDELAIYFGAMIKYTDFSFDKVTNDTISHTVSYQRTSGHQLATIFTAGTHTYINGQFYVRTMAGLGGFMLRGDYKKQYNQELDKNNNPGEKPNNIDFLPKVYLGINLGFSF